MANRELQTLNAVIQNKDISTLYAAATDALFVAYGDVWQFVKDYHTRYHDIPSINIIQEKFYGFEAVEVGEQTSYYLEDLRNEHLSARLEEILLKAGSALDDFGPVAVLNKLQQEASKLNTLTGTAQDMNVMDLDQAEKRYDEVRERTKALGGVPGIKTGIKFIDSAYTSGLAPGDLVVVLGWTGRAKSLFTTLVACNAHDCGFTPMIASLEMSGEKVQDRVLTIKGSGLFRNSSLALGDIPIDSFREFKSRQKNDNKFIVVTSDAGQELTPNIIESKIDQHKPNIVFLDYAQLASDNANSENMTQRMMNMSKEYKRLAVRKQVVMVLISSATGDGSVATDVPPTIEQVAWSKQLAYDADLAFAVHKYDDSNIVEIVCRKNRNGPKFSGFLDWDIDNGKFKEVFEIES